MSIKLGVNKIGEFNPQMLLAGDFPRVSISLTLESGQTYKAGSIIGADESVSTGDPLVSGGMWEKSGSGNTTLVGVLAEDVDALSAAAVGVVWVSGEFALNRVILKDEDDRDSLTSISLSRPIFFHNIELAS